MANKASHTIVLPLKLTVEPMVRLLVISVKNDPEFEGFEPQVFDDPIHGKGLRFLRYRMDHTVDVYWQQGVHTDPFALGAGTRDFAEVAFERARFEITDAAVDVDIAFHDLQGRAVELKFHEGIADEKDFHLLAPVGSGINQPDKLLLVDLLGFRLAQQKRTEVQVRIGDRNLNVPALPFPFDLHKALMVRYASKPVVAVLNPVMVRPVVGEVQGPGSTQIDGMTVTVDAEGHVSQLLAGEGADRAEMTFAPHFPSLVDLPCGGEAAGTWNIRIAEDQITGGTYHLERRDDEVTVVLRPTERWNPVQMPWDFKLFAKVNRVFSDWPKTYRWKGNVRLGNAPSITGGWERN